jgi:hypothetical protein
LTPSDNLSVNFCDRVKRGEASLISTSCSKVLSFGHNTYMLPLSVTDLHTTPAHCTTPLRRIHLLDTGTSNNWQSIIPWTLTPNWCSKASQSRRQSYSSCDGVRQCYSCWYLITPISYPYHKGIVISLQIATPSHGCTIFRKGHGPHDLSFTTGFWSPKLAVHPRNSPHTVCATPSHI